VAEAEEAAWDPVWACAGAVPGGGERDADGVLATADTDTDIDTTTDADADVYRDCHGQPDVDAITDTNEYANADNIRRL
jgi:hypothetical protein